MSGLDVVVTLGWVSLLAPVLALGILVSAFLLGRRLPERRVHQLVAGSLALAFLASLGLGVLLPFTPEGRVELEFGQLLAAPGYGLHLGVLLDPLGVTFLVLDMLLCGLVGAFSASYLHRDPGYHRFFLLLMAFAVGIAGVAVGGSLDVLLAGWELVGLSSALLIAFFHRRASPVRNGLRAYAVYRVTDAGLFLAVLTLHHLTGTTEFLEAFDSGRTSLLLALLLVVGAMGKGAIVPFTGWLPRAMEGPTPSSAIFYGALSIHASPFLLLRAWPLLESHPEARLALGLLGLVTAVHATMVGRVQSDVKSTLAYASVAQVGLLWVEIALGLPGLALVHLVGHAILRTWQLLRAPSLLRDRGLVMEAKAELAAPTGAHWERLLPLPLRRQGFRFALERWFLDELAAAWLVRPIARIARGVDRLDASWARRFETHEPPRTEVTQP